MMSHPPPSSSPSSSPGHNSSPSFLIEVDVSPGSDSRFFVDLSGDLAHVGIFVATWRPIPLGRAIVVGSHLSDGRIVVSGRVRWVRDACEAGPGVGIVLEGLSAKDGARIARFCDEWPPYYYEVEAA